LNFELDAHLNEVVPDPFVSLAANRKVTYLTVSTVAKTIVIFQAVEMNTVYMHTLLYVTSQG